MKFLLFLLVVLLGVWLWRSNRPGNAVNPKSPPRPTPQDMVSCTRCGLHITQADSVQGQRGVYCSHAHREEAEP